MVCDDTGSQVLFFLFLTSIKEKIGYHLFPFKANNRVLHKNMVAAKINYNMNT